MKKIILTNCNLINNANRGCLALGVSTIYLLDNLFTEKGEQYKIYMPLSGYRGKSGTVIKYPLLNKEIDITLCNYPFSSNITLTAINIAKGNFFKDISIFANADYIIDIGYGDSFSDIYGIRRFREIYDAYLLAKFFNKKYIILPQTIGPFKDNNISKKAKKAIEYAYFTMPRDKQSLDCVKTISNRPNLKEYIDVAFYMPYEPYVFSDDFIHVGLNISSLIWRGGYSGNNEFGIKCDYQKLTNNIILYFLSNPKVKIHLVPHVIDGEINRISDYSISLDIVHKINNPRLILSDYFLSPVHAKNYIAGLDFFLGARMHSTIAAFSSGVPVVPMAYSRKFNGLFCDTLNYPYVIDMTSVDCNKAVAIIDKVFKERINIGNTIKDINNSIVSEKKNLIMCDLLKML